MNGSDWEGQLTTRREQAPMRQMVHGVLAVASSGLIEQAQ
jgi:hypothetical protein